MSYIEYQTSDIQRRFLKEARSKRRRIGVGIINPTDEVVDSLWAAAGYVDLVVVGSKIDGLNCTPTKDDDEASQVLCELAKKGEVEGFCRAQLKDSYTHHLWREMNGIKETSEKGFISFLSKGNRWFAAVSLSNYNSLTLDLKRYEITEGVRYLEQELGIKPTIAIQSTRRLTGRVGEFGPLEEIAERCEKIAEEFRTKGYDVKEYYINYEEAVRDGRTLICPSVGMIGNTWAKGLIYLGGWDWIFSPYFHEGAYYESSPRNITNWFWPIVSCAAWANRGRGNK